MEYVTKQEFEALKERVAKLESANHSKVKVPMPKSIREFILEKGPKSAAKKAICLIYYKDSEEGITSGELKQAFREARETPPNNIPDALCRCADKGWIVQDDKKRDGKNIWRLTNTGIKYVEGLGES